MQATIEGAGKFDPEVLKKINYKFRLDWNYHSNAMEGNSLTKEETRSVMVNNVTVEGKPLKDVLEIKGHDQVINDILKIGKGELNLSEKRIKDIHKAIIHEDSPAKQQKIGQWKTENNHLINYKDEKFDFLGFSEVPQAMHELMNWLNAQTEQLKTGKGKLHPALIAFEFHLQYLTIHPFYDGNGRTARILTNLILISFGYPPVIIKTEEKQTYYRYLADVQGYGGDPELYYEFMCKLLIHSQELILKAIHGENIEDPDDLDKGLKLLKRKLLISPDEIQKSGEVMEKLWEESFEYLIKEFLILQNKFKGFFENPSVIMTASVRTSSIPKQISTLTQRKEIFSNHNNAMGINSFHLIANFYGFRKYNNVSSQLAVIVSFSNIEYKIDNHRGLQIIKNYSEPFTNDEIDKFLQQTGKILLDELNEWVK